MRRTAPRRYRANAKYYDFEFACREYLQHDVPFFLRQLPKKRQSVLELGAGTGRAAIPIAQAGHAVVGVDNHRDMLAIARRKAGAVGLRQRDLALVHADALKLSLGRRFDWVCIFFNTFLNFTTLAEQDRLLGVARDHLKPGGRFWLDIFQPDLELLAQESSTNLDPCQFYVPMFDRTVMQMTEVQRDPARQVQHVTFHYRWFDRAGREHRERTDFDMTFIFPRELQILLERNGLRIEKQWGDYDGSPLDADSPRIIARCARM